MHVPEAIFKVVLDILKAENIDFVASFFASQLKHKPGFFHKVLTFTTPTNQICLYRVFN